MTLGYPGSDIVLGLKGERSGLGLQLVRVRVQQYGVGLNSMSVF